MKRLATEHPIRPGLARGRVAPGRAEQPAPALEADTTRVRTLRQLAWRRLRRHKPAMVGLTVLAIEVALALLAPLVVPEERAIRPQPLAILQNPSAAHLLGTDEV